MTSTPHREGHSAHAEEGTGRDALAARSAGREAAAAGVETACDADPG